MDDAPLIVTCGLDEGSFRFFDDLRREHFPPERNHLAAHLTLFHHLHGDSTADVQAALVSAAAATRPQLKVIGLRKLGAGVAYTLRSETLASVRQAIAMRFADSLTPQDRQGFRPHVTVQNKASPRAADALYEALAADFEPFTAEGVSLQLWRYRGGPWEAAGVFAFADAG